MFDGGRDFELRLAHLLYQRVPDSHAYFNFSWVSMKVVKVNRLVGNGHLDVPVAVTDGTDKLLGNVT